MTPEAVIEGLIALVGKGSDLDSREIAHDAVALALEEDRTRQGEELFRAASRHLEALSARARENARRARFVPLESAGPTPEPAPPRRRKQGWKGRYPKGTVVSHAFDSGRNLIPTGVGDPANQEMQFAAAHLALVDLPRLATGEPYSVHTMELVEALYREQYGVAPRFHWAHVLMQEIDRANRQALQDSDPNRDAPAPTTSEATLVRKKAGPDQEKRTRVSVEAEVAPTMPGRQVRRLFRNLDGRREPVGFEVMTSEPEMLYPSEPEEKSKAILNVVRLTLAGLPVPQHLPGYVDNPTLVRWLLARAGSDGGGGLNKVKNGTLLAWLCDANDLAHQVERYGQRRGENGTDSEAKLLKSQSTKLAGQIRADAQS